MESDDLQKQFFQQLKSRWPQHMSLADEIAELLNISNDSAYRRIRGEKPIAFEELQKLCGHFKISLDQFFHLQSDAVIFTAKTAGEGLFDYEKYLLDILDNLRLMNSFQSRE